jgi:hypothetical protein
MARSFNEERIRLTALATEWRNNHGYTGKGGVIVVFNDEVQGWVNALRNPEHWVAGCMAIDEEGGVWQTIAGNNYDGALIWLPVLNPDAPED